MDMDVQANHFISERLKDAKQGGRELVIVLNGGTKVAGKVISVDNGVFHMHDFSFYRISAVAGIESEVVAYR